MKRLYPFIIASVAFLAIPAGRSFAAENRTPWIAEAISLANREREHRGIATLTENRDLDRAAELKLADMKKGGYFAHTSPSGLSPWSFMDRAGYGYRYAGENLAIHFTDPESEHSAWMKSEKHCQNILDPRFREIGMAVGKTFFEGRDTMIVVEMFGTRQGEEIATAMTKDDALTLCRGGIPVVSGATDDRPSGRVALLSSATLPTEAELDRMVAGLSDGRYDFAQAVVILVLALTQAVAVGAVIRIVLVPEAREGVYIS
ncbi:MAG: hypothetical protein HGB18_05055 [Candidatus Moranbacteria bacterium]|nr:hypothetical protein [Candidatus Moranbacteria bacterium]